MSTVSVAPRSIQSSNTNFAAISSQAANLEAGLSLLPGTLVQTNQTLGKVQGFAAQFGPTLTELQPFARALAPALTASRPLFHNHAGNPESLRPFSIAVQPLAESAEARGHEAVQGGAAVDKSSVGVINTLLNTLAYQPSGGAGIPVLGLVAGPHRGKPDPELQDAQGPTVRGIFMATCPTLNLLETSIQISTPSIAALLDLLNAPDHSQINSPYCPPSAASEDPSGR